MGHITARGEDTVASDEEGTWSAATVDQLAPGDRVRVTQRFDPATQCMGTVLRRDREGVRVHVDGGREDEWFSPNYRTFEKWISSSAEEGGTWVPVSSHDLSPGDRAKGVGGRNERVGTVESVSHGGFVKLDTTDGHLSSGRAWYRWVPAAPEVRWEPIDGSLLREGMYVRGEPNGTTYWTPETVEGHITEMDATDNHVLLGEDPAASYREIASRKWFRRMTEDVVEPTPEPTFAPPVVGERFNRVFDNGRDSRLDCEVLTVTANAEGWRVTYSWNGGDHYGTQVHPNGTCGMAGAVTSGRFERITPPTASSDGWVRATAANLEVGDIVIAAPYNIGGLMRAEVTRLRNDGSTRFNARTLYVHTPSSNGVYVDRVTRGEGEGYVYHFGTTPAPLVWKGEGPAPEWQPSATSAAAPVTDLPSWAAGKTLDEVKRAVHTKARSLYKDGSNCWAGTRDFLSGMGLPEDPEQEYPAPPDESDQVRTFLAEVYEVATQVGTDHGKSSAVRGWLRSMEINPPAPTTRRVSLEIDVPIDADVRGVVSGLGWTIHQERG
jgi:hypothetical protein